MSVKLIKHDFPFLNPCWLYLMTCLSFMCLEMEQWELETKLSVLKGLNTEVMLHICCFTNGTVTDGEIRGSF